MTTAKIRGLNFCMSCLLRLCEHQGHCREKGCDCPGKGKHGWK